MTYDYYDFERAYYHNQVYDCKEIGLYLLSKINTKQAKSYYKKLEKVEWSWNMPQKSHAYIADLLQKIKVYLMVNK